MATIAAFAKRLVEALALDQEPIKTAYASLDEVDVFVDAARDAVFGYLACPTALSTNARLLEGDKELPRDSWSFSRIGHGQVIHTELKNTIIDREILTGMLLVVDSIDECDRTLMLLRESLEYKLRARAWINAYVTANDRTNFGLHSDTHDTIIIQILGKKRWVVDSHGRGVLDENDMALATYDLVAGDALAMAGDTAHNVSGIGELTTHLTVGFDRSAALPYHLNFVDELLGRVPQPISAAEMAQGKANTRERRTGTSLPFLATGDLRDCRHVRWASRLPPLVSRTADGVTVVSSMGRQTTFAPSYCAAIDALLSGDQFSLDEFAAIANLTKPRLVQFLNDAVNNDLIIAS